VSDQIFSEIIPFILGRYQTAHGLRNVPLKVDYLRQMIEDKGCVDRIIWERFEFDSRIVIAKVEFYRASLGVYAGQGDYAKVQYSSSLNFCWQRFVVLKEMYHCILDSDQGNRITNIADLLKLGEMLVSDVFASIGNFPPVVTEHFAEIAAVETLFPIELRSIHKDDYDAGRLSDYELALRYRIPERYIRFAMLEGYYEYAYGLRADNLIAI
jgi:hypothetical protein